MERGLGVSSIEANRNHWNQSSNAYQAEHDPQIGAAPRLWGMFSLPDSDLKAMGDVAGQRVLELGCGAGQWSRGLAAEAGAVVGFDLSEVQLGAARRAMGATRYPLIQGAAERLPFADASFDLVFCDHGGLSWAPPEVAIPEAGRVLRSGGRLVFNVMSPLAECCYDEATDSVDTHLHTGYFDLGAVAEQDGAFSYQLSYGGWIAVLRRAGLVIEALIEPRPAPGTHSSYLRYEPPGWPSSWPAEALWVASKP
jgi:SAM-dependent methyltransferase